MLGILLWLDSDIFRHKWTWLCNLTWDWQIERDAKSGALDRMMERLPMMHELYDTTTQQVTARRVMSEAEATDRNATLRDQNDSQRWIPAVETDG